MNFHEAVEIIPDSAVVAVVTHPSPDPDAIGSALAIQWLLHKYDIHSDIVYAGKISHPMNQAMMNVFTLPLKKTEDISGYTYFILVDCTEQNTGFEYFKDHKAQFVIDHHKVQVAESEHDFVEVTQCGACCSILYNLIQEKFTLDSAVDEDLTLINCLLLGIKADTDDLLTESLKKVDFEAYQALLPLCTLQKINAVVNYPIPKYLYELRSETIKEDNYRIIGSTYVTGIGIIAEAKRDALPILADDLLRMDGIDTTIIFCVIADELKVSVRSRQMTRDMTEFCTRLWGKYGGGKFGSGGASVPLKYFRLNGRNDMIKQQIYDVLRDIVFFDVSKEISAE